MTRLSLRLSSSLEHIPALPKKRRLKQQLKMMMAVMACQSPCPEHLRLHLVFVDEEQSRTMNHRYRQKDYSTNILTFRYPSSETMVIADLVFCFPILIQEARAQKRSLRAHTYHLLVHGLLHALGYDHEQSEAEAETMEMLECLLLSLVSISDPYAPSTLIHT